MKINCLQNTRHAVYVLLAVSDSIVFTLLNHVGITTSKHNLPIPCEERWTPSSNVGHVAAAPRKRSHQWCPTLTPKNTKTIERITCHCFLRPVVRVRVHPAREWTEEKWACTRAIDFWIPRVRWWTQRSNWLKATGVERQHSGGI